MGFSDRAGASSSALLVDLGEKLLYCDLAGKLNISGIEAPGVVNTITPGTAHPLSGSLKTVFEVTILPPSGEAYPATITQWLLQAQVDDLSAGDAITVRYDPDEPTAAIIVSW